MREREGERGIRGGKEYSTEGREGYQLGSVCKDCVPIYNNDSPYTYTYNLTHKCHVPFLVTVCITSWPYNLHNTTLCTAVRTNTHYNVDIYQIHR